MEYLDRAITGAFLAIVAFKAKALLPDVWFVKGFFMTALITAVVLLSEISFLKGKKEEIRWSP